jgi:hypothetical protein
VEQERENNGRPRSTSFCIVDAQSVKNTDTAKDKGYDAGKKVSGIKRHIAVDTQGLPHAIAVTTAEVMPGRICLPPKSEVVQTRKNEKGQSEDWPKSLILLVGTE